MKDGIQEVAVISGGNRTSALVGWDATTPHVFKIVVVTPGERVDFYIDGVLVDSLTTNVPKADFLLSAAEVKADYALATGVATLDVYGGLIGDL